MTNSRHAQAGVTALGFLILASLVGVVGLGATLLEALLAFLRPKHATEKLLICPLSA